MTSDLLLGRARELWTELAVTPVEFSSGGANVVVSPGSWLCPPLWTGLVVLGGAGIVTAPSARAAKLMVDASRKLSPEELVERIVCVTCCPSSTYLGRPPSSISTGSTSFLHMEAPLSRR
ncbi:hypothetical protein [Streptomyces sp. NPDC005077]|uniref:hypothetical protein n=1 Tax=Streptomyces sp. NPDC005077 TaxID=3154292 RepID=UPI0033A8CC21